MSIRYPIFHTRRQVLRYGDMREKQIFFSVEVASEAALLRLVDEALRRKGKITAGSGAFRITAKEVS